ncbi:MAG: FeoB-associated Cys-rich membrane protein [Melioribacteraceae bacterium]
MFQDILVFLIVISTIVYVIYSFTMSLKKKKTGNSCGGCTGCSLSEKCASIQVDKININ